MKASLLVGLLIGLTACVKQEIGPPSVEEIKRSAFPGPATGRTEYVSADALLAAPEAYSERRIILAGVWQSGFEHSNLILESSGQTFRIWVEFDWKRIDGPAGDFSRRKGAEKPTPNQYGYTFHNVFAEGTFYFKKSTRTQSNPDGDGGYGHMNGSEGYFIIDRLFRFAPENPPNKSPEPTPTAVTPPATGKKIE